MRYILFAFVIFYAPTLYSHHPSWTTEDTFPPLSSLSCAILNRYYHVRLLSARMRVVQFLYSHNPFRIREQLYETISLVQDNTGVYEAMLACYKNNTIVPLEELWKKYATYHHIGDATINDCMYKSINHLIGAEVDRLTKPPIEAITFRAYFLKKIENTIKHILNAKGTSINVHAITGMQAMFFKHHVLQECMREISEQKSIQPFLALYRRLEAYEYVEEVGLYKEFLMCMFLIMQLIHHGRMIPNRYEINFVSESYCSAAPAISYLIKQELAMSSLSFVHNFFRRMYSLKRIGGSTAGENNIHVYRTHSIQPLGMVWQEFSRYMRLDSQLLIDVDARELFLLANEDRMIDPESSAVFQYMPIFSKEHSTQDVSDIQPFVLADDVLVRWYYIERLQEITRDIISCGCYVDHIHAACNDVSVVHPAVQACAYNIMQSRSMQPLRILMQKFASYYYIADPQFDQDYLRLLYVIGCTIIKDSDEKNAFDVIKASDYVDKEYLLTKLDSIAESIARCDMQRDSEPWSVSMITALCLAKLQALVMYAKNVVQ